MTAFHKKITLIICLCLAIFSWTRTNAQSASSTNTLHIADSLFTIKDWKGAKALYVNYLKDTSVNALEWNRLGYCNHNLGLYDEAMKDYEKSLANKPNGILKSIVSARIARLYSRQNKVADATAWLVKTGGAGYNVQVDVDTMADFKNVRLSLDYASVKQKIYEAVYPCAADPRNHDFDFWIGEWDVYRTGSQQKVGTSSIQSIAGSCAVLENWTSTAAHSGKSFNYYDVAVGKWEQDWLGSSGAVDRQRFLNGEYKDGIMSFTSEFTDPKGIKNKGNFRFYNVDKNTVRQYYELSTDGGKTYTPSYDFTYVRKKG